MYPFLGILNSSSSTLAIEALSTKFGLQEQEQECWKWEKFDHITTSLMCLVLKSPGFMVTSGIWPTPQPWHPWWPAKPQVLVGMAGSCYFYMLIMVSKIVLYGYNYGMISILYSYSFCMLVMGITTAYNIVWLWLFMVIHYGVNCTYSPGYGLLSGSIHHVTQWWMICFTCCDFT